MADAVAEPMDAEHAAPPASGDGGAVNGSGEQAAPTLFAPVEELPSEQAPGGDAAEGEEAGGEAEGEEGEEEQDGEARACLAPSARGAAALRRDTRCCAQAALWPRDWRDGL